MGANAPTRRRLLRYVGGGLAGGVAGCTTRLDPSTGSPDEDSESRRPSRVVEREGTNFVIDGERCVFSGVANCCLAEGYTSRARLKTALDAATRLDTDVIRFKIGSAGGEANCGSTVDGCDVSFQPRPGEFSEIAFEHLDRIVAEAGKRGIRVILPLVDNWGPTGMDQYIKWAGGDRDADFYALEEAQSLYRGFVEKLLTRTNTITGREYRTDPTVLMWELANEPRPRGDHGELLYDWVEDTAAFIHDHDVAQLVSTGSDIYAEDRYTAIHAIDGIDACSIHLWPQNWNEPDPETFGREYITDRVARGHEEVGKPVYLGEYGWRVNLQADDADAQIARRNELFGVWHDAALAADVDGLLAWELLSDGRLQYHRMRPGKGETVGFACPEHEGTCEELRSVARRVDQRSETE